MLTPARSLFSIVAITIAFSLAPDFVAAQTSELTVAPRSEPTVFENSIKPLLADACFDCHSGDAVEGNFRVDQLDPDLVGGGDTAWWLEVYSVISKEEMPPPESSELDDTDRAQVVQWLAGEIQKAEKSRKASGSHSSFRRLTRYEYNYALQDLLGVPWNFARDLPVEASEENAFENNADSLHMSVKQIETYRQLARQALRRVTVTRQQPAALHWSVSMKGQFDREKLHLDKSIKSAKDKFDGDPEGLAEEIKRLNREFQAPASRSHFLERSSGLRADVNWEYRGARYAIKPTDDPATMPEVGEHFAVIQPGSRDALTVELGDRLPDSGTIRVRVRASLKKNTGKRFPSLQLHFGFQSTNEGRAIQRVSRQDVQVTAPPEQPAVYQWEIPLSEILHRNSYRGETQLGDLPSPSEYIRLVNSTIKGDRDSDETAILIDHIEVTAPSYAQWPPQSHRQVFFRSENSDRETEYAREIISEFLQRAWRRVPTSSEVDRKLRLYDRLRPLSDGFEETIVEVLATALSSPNFLYVLPGRNETATQDTQQLTQVELATRLSLLLWCSLPDEELLELASKGRLREGQVLTQQVKRMLADPRCDRFSRHFVSQWLSMQPLEFLSPTRGDNGIDDALLDSIKQEPVALFTEMLRQDSSVMELLDSNYVVINERLAQHYGVPGVDGNHFRRVELPPESTRGGLLTQAGLLTMNSDGNDSHPVKRGVWLLTSLLNDPPPPPPPAVPEIDLSDPAIAKMTLKERIEDHRNHAACMSCHQKIDPWGIAFENFDATGRWRDKVKGKTIDATSTLPNEATIDGVQGLKEYLVSQRRDQFVRATVEKLASFALGRQLAFSDRASITDITNKVTESGGGVKTMVICLVTSELFQSK
ncbi:MAG: DUF1592 domain-containing protein [Aureliella sp.]